MKKEVIYTFKNGIVKSDLTETETFYTKKQDGWDMIGYNKIGKDRITWLPIGANLIEIIITEAETGRRLQTIDCTIR